SGVAGSSLQGIELLVKALAVLAVVLAAAQSDGHVAVAAILVYALAYTLALVAAPAASAKGEFHPEDEFELHDWLPIHLGPLNMSINKAVAYLLLGSL